MLLTPQVYSQNCEKCNLKPLKVLSENIDSLSYTHVRHFVCTFSDSCRNNAEFSEWSNELLFTVIESNPEMLNQVLHDLGWPYVELICKELKDPVQEVDLKNIYSLLKKSFGPKDIVVAEENAILIAAQKQGIHIEK